MTPDFPDLNAPNPGRRVTTSATVRMRTLTKRMNKTADHCRVFADYAASELLCKERKAPLNAKRANTGPRGRG